MQLAPDLSEQRLGIEMIVELQTRLSEQRRQAVAFRPIEIHPSLQAFRRKILKLAIKVVIPRLSRTSRKHFEVSSHISIGHFT